MLRSSRLCYPCPTDRRHRGKQKAKGETWQRNDRLIAVAVHAQTHEIKSMDYLRPHLVDEIKLFFIDNNRLGESKFKPLAESSPLKARKLI
jgi:hypothetical protein